MVWWMMMASAGAATLEVDPAGGTGVYTTVQAAIAAATTGDTLSLSGNTFNECLDFLGKDLTLVGTGSSTLLDPRDPCSVGIEIISGETVTFRDLSIGGNTNTGLDIDDGTVSFENVDGVGYPVLGGIVPNWFILVDNATIVIRDSRFSGDAGLGGRMFLSSSGTSDLLIQESEFSDYGKSTSIQGSFLNVDVGGDTISIRDSEVYDVTTKDGAIHLADATLDVVRTTFRDMTFTGFGGAILSESGTTTITDSVFRDIATTGPTCGFYCDGAGLYSVNTTLTITGSLFERTQANYGGAAYLAGSGSSSVSYTRFVDTEARDFGGALYLRGHTHTLSNLVFTRPSSDWGGAISTFDIVGGAWSDLVFEGATATSDGGAIHVSSTASGTVEVDRVEIVDVSARSGGAMYLEAAGVMDLTDVSIRTADASRDGGAIYATSTSDLSFQRLWIEGATATDNGGGFYITDIDGFVLRDAMVCDTASDLGAGVYVTTHTNGISLENSTFVDTVATTAGGAAYVTGSDPVDMYDLTVVNGSATDGGGVWAGTSGGVFENTIVAHTTSGDALHAADAATNTDTTVHYSAFYSNTTSDAGGSFGFSTGTGGIISGDPLFTSWNDDGVCTNDDFQPATGSPLIDAGEPSTSDPDGSVGDIGADGTTVTLPVDVDGDGFSDVVDCNDDDSAVFPGATETCNSVDDDCDNVVDEAGVGSRYYEDGDGDGYGNPYISELRCSAGDWASSGTDCNDDDDAIYPTATETPYDDIDQDCDGADLVDVDGDGHDGVDAGGTDCDDNDATVYVGAKEIPYDTIDQDCDGEDLVDVDGDGQAAVQAKGLDCDDSNPDIYDGAKEIPYDTIDQDCSGADLTDVDEDGQDGVLAKGLDCDDNDPTIYDGAKEVPYDTIDQDCSGADLTDVDEDGQDGVLAKGLDCDDNDPTIFDGAKEVPYDTIDQDCSGADLTDVDEDGQDATIAGGDDCDDDDDAIYLGAVETPYDGIDQDCSGADLTDVDEDGDPAIEAGGADCDDDDPLVQGLDADDDGVSVCDGDCDDTNPRVAPGLVDDTVDTVDQDCNGEDGPPETPGCGGCSAGGSAVPGAVWMLFLGAFAVRRRRGA